MLCSRLIDYDEVPNAINVIQRKAGKFFSLVSWGGVRLSPLGTSANIWPIAPAPDDRWWVWGSWWNGNWQGNRSTRRKPAPVPLCPPKIPHDLGSNPGRRGGKPATNRLSCGTAKQGTYVPNDEVFRWNIKCVKLVRICDSYDKNLILGSARNLR
jgi:hypothetical protein